MQSATPSDSLFGSWVHTSGFAVSLVILGFAGAWGFPIVAGLLAGDLFASEDRHGTWKTILTRSCTREEVFAGKVLAVGTMVIGVDGIAGSGKPARGDRAGGASFDGQSERCAGLAGRSTCPHAGELAVLRAASARVYEPRDLFSVATRNGILGVLGPLMVALATQLLDLIGKGVIVHLRPDRIGV